MEELAIVVPVYNEQETIELFVREVNKKTENLEIKKNFYFVNDGSSDQTLPLLKKIARQNDNIN